MNNLIELLDEYQNKCVLQPYNEHNLIEHWSCKVISKEWGFIKRLVDNDKINLEELKWHYMDLWELVGNTEFIIMLLSIQDNPIEFLVSILK